MTNKPISFTTTDEYKLLQEALAENFLQELQKSPKPQDEKKPA